MTFVIGMRPEQRRLARLILAAMVTAALAVAAVPVCSAGEFLKHSPEYYKLSERQYRLGDSLLEPEKWREKVAAQKAFLSELEELIRKDPQQPPDVRELADGVRRCIDYDGAAIHWDSDPRMPVEPDAALDFVCWVEDDHLRIAVGNPGKTPRKAALSLRQYENRKEPSEWAAVAFTEVEAAAGEVVVVHFDGIPTTGDPRNRDAEWSFAPFAALTDDAGQKQEVRPMVQGIGGWAGNTAKWLVEAGDAEAVFPQEKGVTFSGGTAIITDYTIYIPRQAQCRHRGTSLPLTPLDKAGLFEADHGYFLKNHPARFKVTLAAADTYDVVSFPEMVSRTSCEQMLGRQFGPRLLQLGKTTPVRRLTVPIPPAKRLDAEPRSPDPAKRIDQLFARMRSELWQVRASAQRQIAAIGAPAVPKMIELLSSTRYDETQYSAPAILELIGEPAIDALAALQGNERAFPEAARVLGKIGGRGIDILLKLAGDPDPKARCAAISGLVVCADPRREKAIEQLVADPDLSVCRSAIAGVAGMGGDNKRRAILFEALHHADKDVRQAAIWGLARWNGTFGHDKLNITQDERAPAIAALLKDAEPDVREAAIRALSQLGDKRTMPDIMAALNDNDAAVRRDAARCLHGPFDKEPAGRELLAAFVALAHDADHYVRMDAASFFGTNGRELAGPYLAPLLKDTDRNTRGSAWRALKTAGYELQQLPGDEQYALASPKDQAPLPGDSAAVVEWLADKSEHRRMAARDELAKRGEAAIEALKKALQDRRPIVQVSAVEALGQIDLPAAKQALEPLLTGTDKLLAYAAAEALAPNSLESTVPVWKKLAAGTDTFLRSCATDALGRTGGKDTAQALLAQLDDPRSEVRQKAIRALGELHDPATLDALFERYLNRQGGELRGHEVYKDNGEYGKDADALQEALIKFGEAAIPKLIIAATAGWNIKDKAKAALAQFGEKSVGPLLAALQGKDTDVRAMAAQTLALLKAENAIEPLARMMDGLQHEKREAYAAMVAFGNAARPVLEKVEADAQVNNVGRSSAAALLVGLGDDLAKHPILMQVVETGDKMEMNELAGRMRKLRSGAFLPLFEKALKRPDVWQSTVIAAGACCGKDAIPIIQPLLNHPQEAVRTGARIALDMIAKQDQRPPREPRDE